MIDFKPLRVLSEAFLAAVLVLALPAHAAPFAYISNQSSNNVSVIDIATNTVVAIVPVGSGPGGVAVNPGGTRAYVVNVGARNVSVIDTGTNSVIATVVAGSGPTGVALNPAGTFAYVVDYNSNGVYVIDTASNTVAPSVSVGSSPFAVAVNSAGTRAYVTNFGSNTVSVIDTASNTVVATVATATTRPNAVAVNPAGTRVYVTHDSSTTVSVIDTATNTVVGTIAVGTGVGTVALGTGSYGVAFNPAGTRAYVANDGSNDVTVINTATDTVIANVPVGTAPRGVALDPTGTFAYVGNRSSNDVSVIDTVSNTVVTTVAVGSAPGGIGRFVGGPSTSTTVPGAPTIGNATAGNAQAAVSFTPPASDGGSPITSYTVISNPGGITASGPSSPIGVTGLANGTAYSFTVTATNAIGTGPPSAASNSLALLAVTIAAESGPGSLRDAITLANVCASPAFVQFAIPGPGPHTIQPTTQLPAITCPNVTVDGYTQSGALANSDTGGGNNAVIQVALDGQLCSACDGLFVSAVGVTIKGLAIHSFSGSGIWVSSGSASVSGNYIGTDAGGINALGNAVAGVKITSQYLVLGSSLPGDRNLISANGVGVWVDGRTGTATASIRNNQIGGKRDGSSGNPNLGQGIHFTGVIYSTSYVQDNFVRYNGGAGIAMDPASTGKLIIARNASYANGGIGIDFGDDGATANDTGVENYPVITSVTHVGSDTVVSGYLQRSPYSYAIPASIELYHNSVMTPPTQTEGERLIDVFTASVDLSGRATFTRTIAGFLAENVSAAATVDTCGDGCNRSSEYSPKVALAAPSVSLSPPTLSFTQLVATPSPAQTVTLTNSGSGPLSITLITASAGFAQSNACPATLAAGASCNISVTFSSVTAGNTSGSLVVSSDASGSPHVVTLSGAALLPPAFAIPTFTSRTPGQVSTVGIAIGNPVGNPAAYSGFVVQLDLPAGFARDTSVAIGTSCGAATYSGTAAGIFSIGSSGSGAAPAGVGCTVVNAQIFVPTTPGTYTLTIPAGGFTISSPFAYSNPLPITATVTVSPVPLPAVALSPSSLIFASRTVGTTSASQAVTLMNSGSASLSIASIVASGDFAASPACPASLAVGASCTIDVRFTPSAVGARSGALTVTSNASGSPHSVALSGTGLAPAASITLTPVSLSFAARTVSTTSPAQTVTVANSGTAPLAISSITASGDFAFTSACGASFAAGATCTIDVTFTPLTTGTRTGAVMIASNASGSPHSVALTGSGQLALAAIIQVTPAIGEFAPQEVGTPSAPDLFVITNVGNQTLVFGDISVTGAGFTLLPTVTGTTYSRCGASIVSGAVCAVQVTFTPSIPGTASGVLHIAGNATNSPVTVSLVASGVITPPTRALSVASGLNFADQPVGTQSAGRALPITNNSASTVAVSDLATDGDFSVSDTCTSIAAHASCSPLVSFRPTVVGARTGHLTIRALSETEPYVVALSGVGVFNPVPQVELSVTRLGFGNTILGVPVSAQVVLRNVGQVAVAIESITASGDFFVGHSCGISIAVGSSCTVNVSFFPRMTGGATGGVEIRTNATGSPHQVQASGVGCALPSLARARAGSPLCGP